jgi:curved DNA-binding protein CbpA
MLQEAYNVLSDPSKRANYDRIYPLARAVRPIPAFLKDGPWASDLLRPQLKVWKAAYKRSLCPRSAAYDRAFFVDSFHAFVSRSQANLSEVVARCVSQSAWDWKPTQFDS